MTLKRFYPIRRLQSIEIILLIDHSNLWSSVTLCLRLGLLRTMFEDATSEPHRSPSKNRKRIREKELINDMIQHRTRS